MLNIIVFEFDFSVFNTTKDNVRSSRYTKGYWKEAEIFKKLIKRMKQRKIFEIKLKIEEVKEKRLQTKTVKTIQFGRSWRKFVEKSKFRSEGIKFYQYKGLIFRVQVTYHENENKFDKKCFAADQKVCGFLPGIRDKRGLVYTLKSFSPEFVKIVFMAIDSTMENCTTIHSNEKWVVKTW